LKIYQNSFLRLKISPLVLVKSKVKSQYFPPFFNLKVLLLFFFQGKFDKKFFILPWLVCRLTIFLFTQRA